ncbi:hypothetical protein Sme01_13300 [Sphaerisporangium melleum]|uniref:Secreted protein n=1 Tax=Sphaerisporangium melleum TaxID=321316 RepID=A0A917QTN4_9ACTN|nr:hypothetical protein [Sphaerisporangium melleum]GGK68100.1 hypothetical protein GCM10007964_08900 [Sphaerisporangium melleum]GII68854.1 hypothetical protein Sme01_13300 [Sphaerisporangium melleum]
MNGKHRTRTAVAFLGCVLTATTACAAATPPGGDAAHPAGTPAPSPEGPASSGAPGPGPGTPAPGPGDPAIAGPPSVGPSPSRPSGTSGQQDLAALAGRVEGYLRQRFPGQYAGVVLDVRGRQVIVYRRPSAALDAALRREFPGAPLRPRDAAHSARELDKIARRVTADVPYWAARGITITSIAVLPDGAAVEVGTSDVAKATRELPKRYGRAPLKIIGATPTLLTPPTATG